MQLQYRSALEKAAGNGKVEVLQLLTQRLMTARRAGGKPPPLAADIANLASQRSGWTPLMCASAAGQWPAAQFLLKSKASANKPNRSGQTALELASAAGHAGLVTPLLTHDAELDLPNPRTEITPLLASCMDDVGAAAVSVLLEARADVNYRRETERDTALRLACKAGLRETVRTLLKHAKQSGEPMSLERQDIHDGNVLHVAARSGHEKLLSDLLRHKDAPALINQVDLQGNTPPMVAASAVHVKAVDVLLMV